MSRLTSHRWFARSIVLPLVLAQMVLGVPIVAQQRMAGAKPLPAPKVNVNRKVPVVTLPPTEPTFSPKPTAEEIFRARVFAEPIVPVGGEPGAAETGALAEALVQYHRDGGRQWRPTLGKFLETHPGSVWRASLLLNIGAVELQGHAYAGALAAWDEAWSLAKHLSDSRGRAVADSAVAEWLTLAASFGQVQRVEERLSTLVDRSFSGSASVKIQRARENAAITRRHPELARYCGPEALLAFLEARDGVRAAKPQVLTKYRGTLDGITLADLRELSNRAGLSLHMAQRVDATEIPVPSIVHWKIGHYATIVAREDDRYRVVDRARNESYWLDSATLFREASGYFLLPESIPTKEWRTVSDDQARSIRGSGPLCPDGAAPPAPQPPEDQATQEPEQDPEPETEEQSEEASDASCPTFGMASYRFQLVTASLLVRDTPLGYWPPKGPAVPFKLSYHQRETLQPQTFSFANLGPKWTLNWIRFVKEEPALGITPAHVWVAQPPGGREVFVNPDGAGVYGAHWHSRATLIRTSTNPIRYERRLRSGAVEVFSVSDGATVGSRRVFLSQVVDPHGQALNLTWDSQLRLVAVTDALGQVSTLHYDLSADPLKVTSISDPFSRTATLNYNMAGQLESVTDLIGLQSRFSYGGDDFISSLTTPYGTTTFRHEPSALNSLYTMRFIEATDPRGGTERAEFQWETPTLNATESSPVVPTGFSAWNASLDRYNTFYWDKRAHAAGAGDLSKATMIHWLIQPEWDGWQLYSALPHSVKRPLENRVWFAYPGQPNGYEYIGGWWRRPSRSGRVLDDGSSQIREATYNPQGFVTSRTDPVGRQSSYSYDTNGSKLLTIRQTTGGLNDLVTSFGSYTGARPQSAVDASGQTTALTYNDAGQVLTVTNSLSDVTTYGYNSSGHLSSITGPVSGSTTTFTHDAYGRPRAVTGPDSYAITIDYDVSNRPIRVTYPDDSYEELTYNRLDLASYRDRQGRLTRYFYDAVGRLIGIRDSLGRTVSQTWCTCGSLDEFVDASGHRTRWERDALGRVTREIRANGSDVEYLYESATSRLKRRTDAAGQQTNYAYAVDDTLTAMTYENETTSTASVTYTYDSNYGRLITMVDGTGTTTYTYHAPGGLGAGRLATVDGPLANDTIAYGYDELGRITSRSLNGATTGSTFDAFGRVTEIADPLGTFSYAYEGTSARVREITYPNSQVSHYTYFGNSGDRRLQQIHHQTSTGATLSKFTYAYSAVGTITTWTQQYQSTIRAYDFTYDAASQLSAAIYRTSDTIPSVLTRYGYGYDAAGNRTAAQVDDVPTAFSYDAMNRLTTRAAGGALAFEGSVSEPATVLIQGKPAMVDAANRFTGKATVTGGTNAVAVTATDPTGNTKVQTYEVEVGSSSGSFTYDANGNLTAHGTRTYEWDAENRLVRVLEGSVQIVAFSYDGFGRRVGKSVGAASRTYVYDGDAILEERTDTTTSRHIHGPRIDEPLATITGGIATYYLADHLGSIVQTTNASEAITLTRQYDPFGKLLAGETTNGYSFTGREWDSEIGLYFYRARYYDASLGRFISEDPIRLGGGTNLYRYVENRPESYGDPTGLQPQGAGAAAGTWPAPSTTAGAAGRAVATAAGPIVTTGAVVGIGLLTGFEIGRRIGETSIGGKTVDDWVADFFAPLFSEKVKGAEDYDGFVRGPRERSKKDYPAADPLDALENLEKTKAKQDRQGNPRIDSTDKSRQRARDQMKKDPKGGGGCDQ